MIAQIKNNIFNLFGKSLRGKYIVFESDDWGSIRMPSYKTFNHLKCLNWKPELDPYLTYDSLESSNDLVRLFEVLSNFKDCNNNYPVITANMVVANPDFDKIYDHKYQNYYYKSFIETYKEYYGDTEPFALIMQGRDSGLFEPQFHGREHLNIYQWMNALRNNNQLVVEAFNNRMISISSIDNSIEYSYMAALDYFSEDEMQSKMAILADGMNIFEYIFNYTPTSFIANCYIWHPLIEHGLLNKGIKYIQGIPYQYSPKIEGNGRKTYKKILHFQGQKNNIGQYYFVRNAFFEPSIYRNYDVIGDTLKRIETAFRYGKPAIIGTHRLNYIGSIDERNQINNLGLLKSLLSKIVHKWPDVQFVSTNKLGDNYNK